MRTLNTTALVLVIIGAINWGLIGFFNFDLIATLFGGTQTAVSRIIYALVGISGLWTIYSTLVTVEKHKSPRTA